MKKLLPKLISLDPTVVVIPVKLVSIDATYETLETVFDDDSKLITFALLVTSFLSV